MKIKKTFKKSISVVLSILMIVSTLAVGIVSVNANKIETMSSVYVTGAMNSWAENSSSWQLSRLDENHYKSTFYLNANSSYGFKLYVYGTPDWNSQFSTHGKIYSGSSYTGRGLTDANGYGGEDTLTTISSTSGYVEVTFDFYGKYDNDSQLTITQTAVTALTASVTPSSATVTSGGSVSLTGSGSGGSGSYTYSWTKTGGTGGTLSPSSGKSTKFTAPTVTSQTEYTVTLTVKDSNISGLTKTATCTITVNPKQYKVTVGSSTNGSIKVSYGTRSASTSGSSITVNDGTTVTLSNTPAAGYKFKEYQITKGSTTTPHTSSSYTVTGDVTVKGIFELDSFSVELGESPNGTVTASDGSSTYNEGDTFTVNGNSSITLSNVPDEGYEFNYYYHDSDTTANKITGNTYKPTKDSTTVYGKFTAKNYNINVDVSTDDGTDGGTAVASKSTVNYDNKGYTVTVTPKDGYRVKTFTVNGEDKKSELSEGINGGTYNGTLDSPKDINVTVVFEKIPTEEYQLVVEVVKNDTPYGKVTYNGMQASGNEKLTTTVLEGDSVKLTITPDRKYCVTSIQYKKTGEDEYTEGIGKISGNVDSECYFTIDNVDGDYDVKVTFAKREDLKTFWVSVVECNNGTLTITHNGSSYEEGHRFQIEEGDAIILNNTSDEGYMFVRYEDENGTDLTPYLDGGSYYPTSDITIKAIFKKEGEKLQNVEVWFKGTTMTTYQVECEFDNQPLEMTRVDGEDGYIGTYITGAYRFYWYRAVIDEITVGETHTIKFTTAKSNMNASGIVNFENCTEGNKIVYFGVDDMLKGTELVDITNNAAAKASFRSVQNMLTNDETVDPLDGTPSARANISLTNADGSVTRESFELGDVDTNDKINIKDAAKIQLYVADLTSDKENMNILGDFDISGDVNIKDAAKLQLKIAELSY